MAPTAPCSEEPGSQGPHRMSAGRSSSLSYRLPALLTFGFLPTLKICEITPSLRTQSLTKIQSSFHCRPQHQRQHSNFRISLAQGSRATDLHAQPQLSLGLCSRACRIATAWFATGLSRRDRFPAPVGWCPNHLVFLATSPIT